MGLAEKILEDKPEEITKFSNTHDTNFKKIFLIENPVLIEVKKVIGIQNSLRYCKFLPHTRISNL